MSGAATSRGDDTDRNHEGDIMLAKRLFAIPAIVVAVGACASKPAPTPAPATTIAGTVGADGYTAPPKAVVIADEAGQSRSVALGPDGAFGADLPKGHSYRLWVATERGNVPLVFPRRSGRLDVRFAVASNGARISLGRVRYLAGAPQTGFTFAAPSSSAIRPKTVEQGDQGNCVDCVDDNDEVECHDGSQGHDNDDNHGQQAGDHVDPNGEIAVPENDPPEEADGCDAENGDNDNDDIQQEGEH